MSFWFVKVEDCDLEQYKKDMQEAFQKSFEEEFGRTEEIILPEEDIKRSLTTKGSVAYKAVVDDEIVGGVVVVIDEEIQRNHLDFLYVKYGTQGKGIGKKCGMKLKDCTHRPKCGKLVHRILKREMFIFM